uniref:Uncharacterized protein n=1 Tax=Setaria viridis TaxID=4556 RepID=A0A4U6T3E8_SETVI|nr:hypothetical protein SEVIR_9G297500v2 [Setaria viridis]
MWEKGKATQIASDGIPHQQALLFWAVDKETAVAAVKDPTVPSDLQGEARGRDSIRRIQDRTEFDPSRGIPVAREEAQERGFPVVGVELAEETGVRDHAAPELTDERGAEEGGWQRRQAAKAIGQEILVLQLQHRRRLVSEQPHLGFRQ